MASRVLCSPALGVSSLRECNCQRSSVSTGPHRSEDSRSSGDVRLAVATSRAVLQRGVRVHIRAVLVGQYATLAGPHVCVGRALCGDLYAPPASVPTESAGGLVCALESSGTRYVLSTSRGTGSVLAVVVCARGQARFRSVPVRKLKTPPTGHSPHVRGTTLPKWAAVVTGRGSRAAEPMCVRAECTPAHPPPHHRPAFAFLVASPVPPFLCERARRGIVCCATPGGVFYAHLLASGHNVLARDALRRGSLPADVAVAERAFLGNVGGTAEEGSGDHVVR